MPIALTLTEDEAALLLAVVGNAELEYGDHYAHTDDPRHENGRRQYRTICAIANRLDKARREAEREGRP